MAEFDGDKQHEATPHRREQAREEGQIARSQDLASAVLLLAGLLMLWFTGSEIANYFGRLFRDHMGGEAWVRIDTSTTMQRWLQLLLDLSWAILPILGVILFSAIGVNLAQVGFLFLPNKVAFDPSHVNPLQNAQRIFSLSTFVRLSFGLFKIAIISVIAAVGVWNQHDKLMSLAELEGPQVAAFISEITLTICIQIAAALVVLALADYGYQYWKQEAELKMTTQELREELKEQSGNPQILGKRKQIQRQMAQSRLTTTVPQADVVVTNPTELAIAIQYDFDTMPAPVVLAKGAGVLAQQIRRIALEKGIAIVERKELAQILYKNVNVGKQIPVEQYAAVAEVLRYVYQLQGKKLPVPKAA